MSRKPPKIILFLFKPFVRSWVIEDIEGDLNELYTERLAKNGKFRADLGYLVDLITMLNMYKTKLKISNNMKSLFVHHLKSSIRGFRRRKEYFLINIAGLVLALSAALLIALHVIHEKSYDDFHENGDRIVRLTMNDILATSAIMGDHLADKFPEIEKNTRINFPYQSLRFKVDQSVFDEDRLAFIDPAFFEIFSFPITAQSNLGLFETTDQIALSEREAYKLFGDENPIGQLITINDSLNVNVTAVFENVPANSHLQFDYLLPIEFKRRMGHGRFLDLWGMHSAYNYFLLSGESSLAQAAAKVDEEIKTVFKAYNASPEMNLQVLSDIHLNDQYVGDLSTQGDPQTLQIYIAAGLLVLIIACVNYVNLSAAIVARRVKEIGVRKVLGAFRSDLFKQYLTETSLLAVFSFLISLLIVKWMVPYFNQMLGHNLSFDLLGSNVLSLFGIYFLGTTVLAGFYPAYLFSSLKSIDAIQGRIKLGNKRFRRILVTLQFSFSLVLLVLTFITKNQLQFISDFDLGYDREGVIVMPLYGHIHNEFGTIKTELLRNGLVESVSASASMPINNETLANSNSLNWEGKDEGLEFSININWVEESYLELFDINLIEGRSFEDFKGTNESLFLINEQAARALGVKNPLEMDLEIWGQKGRVIGITENFNFESVRSAVEPMLTILETEDYEFAFVRYQKGQPLEAIELIESVARQVDANYSSNLSFLDSEFQAMYEEELRTSTLLTVFSTLAILISAMGLFGFITFVVQARLKEMSIRKVLGASTQQLVRAISAEFLIMLGISSLIAWPVALYFSQSWLDNFEYRVAVNGLLFVAATAILLVVTLMVIAGQLSRVIRANPARILRTD